MPEPPAIVWFRHDLRVEDNPALVAAAARGGNIVPVFIWAPQDEDWPEGGASRCWLHRSLASLQEDLGRLKSRLVIRRGSAADELGRLVRETGATSVFWNRRYEPKIGARDARIEAELKKNGVTAECDNASLLFEPWTVKTAAGTPFRVFTPFWRNCLELGEPDEPQPAPAKLPAPKKWPASLALGELKLEPRIPWDAGIRRAWSPGAAEAARELERFLTGGLEDYATERDRPDHLGTSRLSPFLHFGEIGPRQVWHAVRRAARERRPRKHKEIAEPFLRQLVWREFAHHLLYHHPHTVTEPLREKFATFPWLEDPPGLRAWQRGATGYPYIDAGMRQLWTTGWMHNRVRMAVASFLVKDLLIPWQEGARWFWDTLVDADLADNTLGWQWTAGCGADASPFFRVFNPVGQGERFDPEGSYVRHWVPELAKLPREWIHKPWEAPPTVLKATGVELGATYPRPIVDHAAARKRALDALRTITGKRGRRGSGEVTE
ncbi:MAG: cryptochrome/photolyase family protein [Deltaproteobacteria bacterium]